VTHLLDPDALVAALARVGAGVKGLESVSVYLQRTLQRSFEITALLPSEQFFGNAVEGFDLIMFVSVFVVGLTLFQTGSDRLDLFGQQDIFSFISLQDSFKEDISFINRLCHPRVLRFFQPFFSFVVGRMVAQQRAAVRVGIVQTRERLENKGRRPGDRS
jgi:hypothetical protein